MSVGRHKGWLVVGCHRCDSDVDEKVVKQDAQLFHFWHTVMILAMIAVMILESFAVDVVLLVGVW